MGWFDFLKSDPTAAQGGILAPGTTAAPSAPPTNYGLFGSHAPMTGAQKTQMLFAGLQDAFAGYQGKPANNLDTVQAGFQSAADRAKQAQADLAIQQTPFGSDPQAYVQSLVRAGVPPQTAIQLASGQRDLQPTQTLSPQDAVSLGFRPDSVVQRDAHGKLDEIQKPDSMSADAFNQKTQLEKIQQGPQWASLAETGRHNRVTESQSLVNNDNIAATAHGIATYQIAPPTGFAMSRPAGQALMAAVLQQNPNYNAQNYGKYQSGYKAFGTGKQGDTVRSLNVWVQHSEVLQKAALAMQNGDTQAFNQLSNFWKTQTGSPLPTNFDAIKGIYADEAVKAVVGGAGALGDREDVKRNLTSASSPQQLIGIAQSYDAMASGQLNGLRRQYQNSTGRQDFETLLDPVTRAKLESHTAAGTAAPRPGTVQGGYRFKGGNPADPHSWEKVQ